MSEGDSISPGFEALGFEEFMALFNVLKMFVLLSVPEPRRQVVLSLLERMIRLHSDGQDGSREMDDAMLASIREMRDTGATLNAFERQTDHLKGS